MPKRAAPYSAIAEYSLAQIALRFSDYRQLTRGGMKRIAASGRHAWVYSSLTRHGNTMVDLVAVTENFSIRRLLDLRPNVPELSISSWDKRCSKWMQETKVDFNSFNGYWPKLRGFIEARNALQHGLGTLTERQLSTKYRDSTLIWLKAANVTLIGDSVRIDESAVEYCHEVCTEFVYRLDNASRSVG